MLGIDNKETPIVEGHYAKELRDAVRRVYLGQLSDSDKSLSVRSASVKKEYDAVWK